MKNSKLTLICQDVSANIRLSHQVTAIFVFDDEIGPNAKRPLATPWGSGDLTMLRSAKHIAGEDEFDAKLGSVYIHREPGAKKEAKHILFVGLGKRTNSASVPNESDFRKALEGLYNTVRQEKFEHVAVLLPIGSGDYHADYAGLIACWGGLLSFVPADWKATALSTSAGKVEPMLQSITILVACGAISLLDDIEKAAQKGFSLARSVARARDHVNGPANIVTPDFLAQEAGRIAAAAGEGVKVTIWDREQSHANRLYAFFEVARGSAREPRAIILEWTPPSYKQGDLILGLCGKGVCYDTGGDDIKPAGGMYDMFSDMAGSAATLAAFEEIVRRKVPIAVKMIVLATENSVDGASYRSGDVIPTHHGATIDVRNTDAEGRVTLADGISLLKLLGCTKIVTIATLTGAVLVALGHTYTGLWSNKEEFASTMLTAFGQAGEKAWRMPLDADFVAMNKAERGDIGNTGGGRLAGSCTAAEFLHFFAGDEVDFAHLDIAGTGFIPKPAYHNPAAGGTGAGAMALVMLAELLAAQQTACGAAA
jgi:leucyl aminopeptidase